jgi:hypothetical protein
MNGSFPFPPFGQALELIARLNEKQFATLKDAVTGPEAFDTTLVRCRRLAQQAGLESSEVLNTLSSLRFIYDQVREWEESHADEGLTEFLELTGLLRRIPQAQEGAVKRLSELLVRNSFIEKRRKLRWLKTGILDTAVSFSSFVDLRPNITADRNRIDELVPTVIFRVVVDAEYGPDRSFVFQITRDGVAKLKAAVDDIEKKLSIIASDSSLGARLLPATPSDDDEEEE